jgi:glycerol-3-phosphate dehydrogenase subunit C
MITDQMISNSTNSRLHLPPELSLDQCIKCNICTTACPVSAVTDLFPGPKYEAPQAGRFRIPNQPVPDKSVDYCSGCRVCNMVCPTGVKIAEINARSRAAFVRDGKVPIHLRLRNNLVARPELLGKVAHPISRLANIVLNFKPARQFMEFSLWIHHSAPLPSFSNQLFTTWFCNHPKPSYTTRKVVYFHGCSTQFYEPRVGRAAIQVLEANGFEVIVPSQNCCGLPLLSNGEFGAARKCHKSNVNTLVKYARQGIPIVGTSTSCTLTLKEEAPDLLDMHDVDTTLVAENTYDFNEFLLLLFNDGSLNLNFNPVPLTLGYHIPCQYRAHRIGKPGLQIMSLIPELHIIDSHAACCGIAGTYGYKKEKYEISMDVGQSLFDFISRDVSNSPVIVCDSETCRWQITHATGKPAIHPVELIAKSYGIPTEGALASL